MTRHDSAVALEDDEILAFFHIAKTGGTSFNNHLRVALEASPGAIAILNPTWRQIAHDKGEQYWLDWPLRDKLTTKVFIGHDVTRAALKDVSPYKTVRFMTFLREVRSLALSHYNYFHGFEHQHLTGLDISKNFPKYLTQRKQHMSPAFVLLKSFCGYSHDFALRVFDKSAHEELFDLLTFELDQFFFVGLMDHYEADAKAMLARLGIDVDTLNKANVAGQEFQPVLDDISPYADIVDDLFALDRRLHQHYLHRRERLGPLIGKGAPESMARPQQAAS